MNLALVEGLVDEIGPGNVDARLDPAEGRCCVTLTERYALGPPRSWDTLRPWI